MLYMIETFDDEINDFKGRNGSLDSITAKNGADPMFFGLVDKSLINSIMYDISKNGCTAYACTFTYPDISLHYFLPKFSKLKNKEINRKYCTLLEEAPLHVQIRKIEGDIYRWIKLVEKHLPRSSYFKQFAVFFELTKSGRIHGHGIFTTNNSYHLAVSQVLSMYWIKISKGSFCALEKGKGKYTDKAFDKCNNVKKWIEYISKENPNFIFPTDRISLDQWYIKCDLERREREQQKPSQKNIQSFITNDVWNVSQENISKIEISFN